MKLVQFKCKEEWFAKIKSFAKDREMTVSALIKIAIEYYMKREG